MSSGDKKRISRLIAMITIIQTKNLISARDLAERFSVSIRTIYRDLQALEEAGIPIYTEEGKGYRLVEEFHLPPIMFTEKEANALILAQQLILNHSESSLVDDYESAIEKVRAVLSPAMKEKAQVLTRRTQYDNIINKERTSHYLSDLQKALTDYNTVYIEYTNAEGKSSSRIIEPFALLSTKENWLLVAWCRLRKEFRYFRLDRIVNLHLQKDHFKPHNMTIQEFFDNYH